MSEVCSTSASTTDVTSECASSSYLEDHKIAIFCSDKSDTMKCVKLVAEKLKEKGYSTMVVNIESPPGRPVIKNYFSVQRHSQFRIFMLTKGYIQSKLKEQECVLYHINSTADNTLLMARNVHWKKVPKDLIDAYTHTSVANFNTGNAVQSITDQIIDFVMTKEMRSPSNKNEAREPSCIIDPSIYDPQKKLFCEYIKNFTSQKFFILAMATFPNLDNDMRSVTGLPWLKIFDLDKNALQTGLLNTVSSDINRGYNITSTKNPPKRLSERLTEWCIVENCERKNVIQHTDSVVQFCSGYKPVSLVVLWYHLENKDFDSLLLSIISKLKDGFARGPRELECIIFSPEQPTETPALESLVPMENHNYFVTVPLNALCSWMVELRSDCKIFEGTVSLPRRSDEDDDKIESIEITNGELSMIQSTMEILSTNNYPDDESNEKGIEFLKGGTLPFAAFQNSHFDAMRDLTNSIVKYIKMTVVVDDIIKIYHTPGSGGSTIGRKVLWELRKFKPCIYLPQNVDINEDVHDHVESIRDKTHLSPIILLDERSLEEAYELQNMCFFEEPIIILVQRIFAPIKNTKHGVFFLKDNVSISEAIKLREIYGKYGKTGAKDRLKFLENGVKNGTQHYLFEFGLSAFNQDYKGVRNYVKGRLQLNEGEWLPWQRVVAYLALAKYYGNCELPCEMFMKILDVEKVVGLDHIDYNAHQLISEENGTWRITYYMVAKEILQQFLSTETATDEDDVISSDLSQNAKANLLQLVLDFIDMLKDFNTVIMKDVPKHILRIATNIFINRILNEEHGGYKTPYSRLLQDVKETKDQELILKKLSDSFENHAEFHAHLGRFYGKHDQHDEAIVCHKNAIRIRKLQVTTPGKPDEVLNRLHSMFGFCYNSCVQNLNRQIVNAQKLNEAEFNNILKYAKLSIEQFKLCRDNYSCRVNPTYGYIGEIKLRLEVCQFVFRNRINNGRLRTFAYCSFGECNNLFDECLYYSQGYAENMRDFDGCLHKFLVTFSHEKTSLQEWVANCPPFVSTICRLTLLKLDTNSRATFSVLLHITPDDPKIKRFLQLSKEIIDKGFQKRTFRISMYVDEYLQACRHYQAGPTSIRDVVDLVTKWRERNEQGSLATFYDYILTFVLTIQGKCRAYALSKKWDLLMDHQKFTPRMALRTTREYISARTLNENTCLKDILINSFQYEAKNLEKHAFVFVGRIYSASKPHSGIIHIPVNTHMNENEHIKVYFHPKSFDIKKHHEKNRSKVEFIIGFNPRHGAQAFHLRLLTTKICQHCRAPNDMITIRPQPHQICRQCKSVLF